MNANLDDWASANGERKPAGGTASEGFTLVELVVAITIVAALAMISFQAGGQMRSIAQGAYCANSLRQLGESTSLYLGDHKNTLFQYSQAVPGGTLWYFGFETTSSLNSPEGDRSVDVTKSPLYPYVHQVGGVEVCPSFPYNEAMWKPKYQGASWGYGFNIVISGSNVSAISSPSKVMLFGDCAQVNVFEAPASPKNPLLEEFYMFNAKDETTQFRHGGCANILFLDGHVQKFTMFPGTLDTRLPDAHIGRFTPPNSTQYLR